MSLALIITPNLSFLGILSLLIFFSVISAHKPWILVIFTDLNPISTIFIPDNAIDFK